MSDDQETIRETSNHPAGEPHTEQSIQALINRGYSLYRYDQMSYFLKLAISVELRKSKEASERTIKTVLENIHDLEIRKKKTANDAEWETLLTEKTAEEIADILESNSDESQRLRSNFQGCGVISEEKRSKIIHNYCHGQIITPSQILT